MKRIIAGLLAVVLLLAAACAPPTPAPPTPAPPKPAPPVAPNVLKFWLPAPLSGPASLYGPPLVEGWEDYFAYAKEKGLIPEGIELKVLYEDCAYDLAKEVAGYKKYRVDPEVVVSSSIQSGAAEALRKSYLADKIIHAHITVTTRGAVYPADDYSFSVAPVYNEEIRTMMHWLKENHWKEDRPARVGILIWDYATGHAWGEGYEVGARENGWEVIGIEKYPYPSMPDLTPAMLKFKAADVDYICSGFATVSAAAGVFLRDIEKVGLLGKVTPLVCSPNTDESLILLAKEKCEGVIGVTSRALWDAVDVPGVKLAHELRDKYHGGKPPLQIQMYFHNLSQAMVMLEAVRLACADIPAQQVGRENLQKYLLRIKDFDTLGLIGKVTMTVGDPRLGKETQILQVQGGKLVSLSGWIPAPAWKATEWDWK